ncbi:AsnC family transcriptional regulator [Aliiroseovarius zhejiangensis]|uniref:AsnC family transcriptional regulator n=2 Tax=Aliiroseovarius TaxID=1658781 RepID=A0ABQ3J1M0_9RHOB|nr:Lrp/AsnC family transcriptional regulator [Aliiroseovarius zhejiangensis]GHE99717.1 AsnC family transcriptional regulator [Aliiroseovarius zhejiangensis]
MSKLHNIYKLYCHFDMVAYHYLMHIFDDLDRNLIAILREDGRAPISKLAEILGVSRATVQARLDRLLDTGAVLGFTIRARQDHGPDGVHAIMMIEVSGKSATAVIKRLRGLPELRSLHSTNGKWDLVAQLTADNLTHFDRILHDVRMVEGITNSETSILLSTV